MVYLPLYVDWQYKRLEKLFISPQLIVFLTLLLSLFIRKLGLFHCELQPFLVHVCVPDNLCLLHGLKPIILRIWILDYLIIRRFLHDMRIHQYGLITS